MRTGRTPSEIGFDDLDAEMVAAFLEHAESAHGNSVRTRNARLAAIHSFFVYAALHHPDYAALIQRVLAMPHKRRERASVTFLELPELEAILAMPDQATQISRRDHALLQLAAQTGLRQSELTGLRCQDVQLGPSSYVRCGKRNRTTVSGQLDEKPVDRNFRSPAPNRLWAADLSSVSTWSGFVYVAFIIDAFSRSVVGWRVFDGLRLAPCSAGSGCAGDGAVGTREPGAGGLV